jgi:hypothetical protein
VVKSVANSTNSMVGGVQDPWQVLHLEVMHAPKLDEKHDTGRGRRQYSSTFKDVNENSKLLPSAFQDGGGEKEVSNHGRDWSHAASALAKTGVKVDRTGSGESGERRVRFKVCENSHK